MARGFLSGLIWGGVASVGVVGAVSLIMPLPLPPQVGDSAPGSGPVPAHIRLSDVTKQDQLPETPPASGRAVPRADAPMQDDLAAVGADTQTPAGLPETGAAEGLSTPAEATGQAPAQPGAEEPVLPNPQAVAPATPQPVEELSISTEPAQPPAPEVATIEGAFDAPAGMQAPDVAEPGTITLPAQEQMPDDLTEVEAPVTERVELETLEAETPEAETPEAEAPEAETSAAEELEAAAPEAEASAVATLDDAAEPAPEVPFAAQEGPIQPEIEAEQIDQRSALEIARPAEANEAVAPETTLRPPAQEIIEPTPGEEDTVATENSAARPAIGTPATTLSDRDSGVVINRPDAATPENGNETAALPETDADMRPIVANSVPFDVPKGKPLMSFVLIDDGSTVITGGAGLAALRSFPYPLSFAVDTALPDAAERVAIYRAAGFEVLAMIDLPEGAQPSDAETTFAATLDRIGAVVGVLEGTGSGLQDNRAVADQVTDILAQSGHGLVTQDKGLNTMPKLARKDGVPADPVFRDFDSKGQDARVIRRFLDQAAFKARLEGAVIMLGRLRPDTVSALLLWGLQDRASDVALVPISAVLLREE